MSLRIYAERVVIVAEGRVVAEHQRMFSRGRDRPVYTVYDWRHYLAVVQRKPGALRNGAPFATLPDSLRRLQAILLKRPGGDWEMVEILSLVLHHDEQAVVRAAELALEAGAVSRQHVVNLLGRLLDTPPPASAEIPAALRLDDEPKANVTRYDHLRGDRHVR